MSRSAEVEHPQRKKKVEASLIRDDLEQDAGNKTQSGTGTVP